MMNSCQERIMRPWLWLPSQLAHDLSPYVLPALAKLTPRFEKSWKPIQFKKLSFQNPLGIAGGVDKSGVCLKSWSHLGAGFLEVGTITPLPQKANSGKIMARDIAHKALWNKMGFPNLGAQVLKNNLKIFDKDSTPLFINIGKNRWTDNSNAYLDYAECVYQLKDFADAFVINISSPNTKGLRDLLTQKDLKEFLDSFFNKISDLNKKPIFLLKLSPDMDTETLSMALEISKPFVDGWILTNTTKKRFEGSSFPMSEGGVSGMPLKENSLEALRVAVQFKNADKLIVSVGGISDENEILQRLEMGADLVQFYSALVFQGPFFFQKKIRALRK